MADEGHGCAPTSERVSKHDSETTYLRRWGVSFWVLGFLSRARRAPGAAFRYHVFVHFFLLFVCLACLVAHFAHV